MRLLFVAVLVLCGVSMAAASNYEETDMNVNAAIVRLKGGGDESVIRYTFLSAEVDSGFETYIPKDAKVTIERDFKSADESRFLRAYTIESKEDLLRIVIYIHKIGEVTLLPLWASEVLGASGYTIGPSLKFDGALKGKASEFFIGCGAATEGGAPARLEGAQEAVAIAVRNGNSIIVAMIEYGGADLEHNRDLASRFYSNVDFTRKSDTSFAIDKTLKFIPTGTKIAVRTSKNWQSGKIDDGSDSSVLMSMRSTNGEINAMVETKITARGSEHQDYSEKAKQYFTGFVRRLGTFNKDQGYKFGPNSTSKTATKKRPLSSYLFQVTEKNGVAVVIQISYIRGSKEDVAVLSMMPAKTDLGDLFLAFKARASAKKLALDAVELADESMN